MKPRDNQDAIMWAALVVLLLFSPVRAVYCHDEPVSQMDGAKVTALMKHKTVDLRDAIMEGDSATLRVRALAGTVEIRVPRDWNVRYGDSWIVSNDATSPTLIVQGKPFLGSITVSH